MGCGVTSHGVMLVNMVPFFSGGDIFNLNLKNNGTMRGEPWPLFLAKIGFRIQWWWSEVLEMPGSALILTFLVCVFGFWYTILKS